MNQLKNRSSLPVSYPLKCPLMMDKEIKGERITIVIMVMIHNQIQNPKTMKGVIQIYHKNPISTWVS
jgi:hypothetical protein